MAILDIGNHQTTPSQHGVDRWVAGGDSVDGFRLVRPLGWGKEVVDGMG